MTVHICKDCYFFRMHGPSVLPMYICESPDTHSVDLVLGSTYQNTCLDARADEHLCGRAGRHWTERPVPVVETWQPTNVDMPRPKKKAKKR